MVLYYCKFCTYTINKKSSIIIHLNRKNKCSPYNDLVEGSEIILGKHYDYIDDKKNKNFEMTIDNRFKCINCGRSYKNKNSFYTHSKACRQNKEEIEVKKKEDDIIQNTNCNNTINTTTNTINSNNTNCNNNTINIQNNVSFNLLHYGKENLSYINKRSIEELIKEYRKFNDDADIIKNFTNLVHFNEEHPENHNIRVLTSTDDKGLLLKIFMPPCAKAPNPTDGVWVVLNHKDLAERMAGEKIDQLDQHSTNCKLSMVHHELLNEYLDKFSFMRTKSLEDTLEHLFLSKTKVEERKPLRKLRRSNPYICSNKPNIEDMPDKEI